MSQKEVVICNPVRTAMCKLIAAHTKGQRWTGPGLRKALNV